MILEFINAVSAVFLLFLIMSIGYICGKLGWMGKNAKDFLSKYILNIAVPCLCISGILGNIKHDDLSKMGFMIIACVASIVIILLLAWGISRILKLERKRKGVFISMCAFSNTIFIGLPVCTQLFGRVSVPYIMVYYICSTTLVQCVGVLLVEWSGNSKKSSGREIIKSIFTKPPILAVLFSLILLVLDLALPPLLMSFMGYVSDTVAPMALVYCGFILFEIGLKNLRMERGFISVLLCRLVVAPAIIFGLCLVFGIHGLPRDVLLIESALPVITQVSVMSGAYGADEKYAVSGSSISMFAAFITIPIWMLIL
jgi:predicted permease